MTVLIFAVEPSVWVAAFYLHCAVLYSNLILL